MSMFEREKLALSRRGLLLGSMGVLAAQACRASTSTAGPKAPVVATRAKVDLDRFIADCIAANQSETSDPQAAVKEVLARGVHDPRAMLAAVGEIDEAGMHVLHRSSTLTIFSAVWAPLTNLMPHNHRMWALIGIYAGREDNIFWHRSERGVSADSANCLFEGDVAVLPASAIHSVTNPLERYTAGIHVYGGDFFATPRSQWDPETRAEQPSDGAVIRHIFDRTNKHAHCILDT